MIFSPPKTTGLAVGLAAIALILGLDAAILAGARAAPLSFLVFVAGCFVLASLAAVAYLAYGCYGLWRARYVLSRNALVVEWGGRRELIPMDQVGDALAGAEVDARLHPRSLTWPGYVAGRADLPPLGEVEFLSAAPQAGQVLVQYAGGWLAISPPDPEAFLAAFAERRAEGVLEAVAPESVQPRLARWAFWHDRLALGLVAVGGASVLALVGYLLLVYPQLPSEMALHFNALGQPDRFGPPSGLFILPVIAGLAWGLNTLAGAWLHQRDDERAGAYLLFGAAVFIQALVWVAAIGLLTAGRV